MVSSSMRVCSLWTLLKFKSVRWRGACRQCTTWGNPAAEDPILEGGNFCGARSRDIRSLLNEPGSQFSMNSTTSGFCPLDGASRPRGHGGTSKGRHRNVEDRCDHTVPVLIPQIQPHPGSCPLDDVLRPRGHGSTPKGRHRNVVE